MKVKNARVVIEGSHTKGVVAPEFVSFTMDFWPASHDPSFADSSIITNANLGSSKLLSAARGLAPAFFRIGGSMADRIVYEVVPNARTKCKNADTCLTMARWDEILRFAQDAGVRVVFCLNYIQRIHHETTDWDGSNAYEFLNYTKHHAPPGVVYGFELGNEPFHTAEKNTNVTRYQLAYKALRTMVSEIWDNDSSRPKIVGPAASRGGQFDKSIKAIGKEIDIATYHMYRGDGKSQYTAQKAMTRGFFAPFAKLDQVSLSAFKHVNEGTELWMGEGAMAMHSGRDKVTNTFMGSFWYANQLGELAKTLPMVNKVFCRQTLMGGYYELVSHNREFAPNPDYWIARLWKKLMGQTTLEAYGKDCCIPGGDDLIVHAFCAKPSDLAAVGDVTLLLINIANAREYHVQVEMGNVTGRRSEFVVESLGGRQQLAMKRVLINGETPTLDKEGEILPPVAPKVKKQTDPIIASAHTITFVVLHDVLAVNCMENEEDSSAVASKSSDTGDEPPVEDDNDHETKEATTSAPSMEPSLEIDARSTSLPTSITMTSLPSNVPSYEITTQEPTVMSSEAPTLRKESEQPTEVPETAMPSTKPSSDANSVEPSVSSDAPTFEVHTTGDPTANGPSRSPSTNAEDPHDGTNQLPHDGSLDENQTSGFASLVIAWPMVAGVVVIALIVYKKMSKRRYAALPSDEAEANQRDFDMIFNS